ncbi:MAG: ice-binding family protein [Burkholderiales bacterium]
MNRFGNPFNPLTWFLALVLAVLVAGCGDGTVSGTDGTGGTGLATAPGAGTGVGGAGQGPAPLNLGAAGNFVILAESTITSSPPSDITGDVGLSPAAGSKIVLTCAEVTGSVYDVDGSFTDAACLVTDPTTLTTAIGDKGAAFTDANSRAADYTELGAGDISGLNLGPATYKWGTGVLIASDLTLTGGPNDVWIFQIAETLTVSSGVQIVLAGGALPENIFWATFAAADFDTTSVFKGVVLSQTAVVLKTGATLDGRALAGTAVNLDKNVVTQP